MKTIKNFTEVSNKAVEQLQGLTRLKDSTEISIEDLHGWKKTGAGHWKIGVDIQVKTEENIEVIGLTATTTNSQLKDSWTDHAFDEDSWYEDEQAVTDAYFWECLTGSNIEILNEFIIKTESNETI